MRHELVDRLVMLAELTVKRDRLAEFLEYTVENLKVSRSYPGNIQFDILVNETKPEKVIFYEVLGVVGGSAGLHGLARPGWGPYEIAFNAGNRTQVHALAKHRGLEFPRLFNSTPARKATG